MSKNILIITGSPRPNKNTTQFANAYAEGATRKGHNVTTFNTSKKKVNPCIACDKCWSKGTACVFNNDSFNELSEQIEVADIIVFATPLYWYTFSAQIKSAIDKLYSFTGPNCTKKINNKESVLLSCGEDTDDTIFDGLISTFKSINVLLGWTVRDISTVKDIENVDKSKILENAQALGYSI